MENGLKVLLGILLVLYVISPVDLAPGPIDDIIVIIIGIAAQKSLTAKRNSSDY
ncbi:hypothetical protein ACTQZS_14180 [Bilifractor sp. LCP19S3_H10]|uniref:hypothetical protein n=1 Tax=Bilifractor sp. LCP19S3_H10 TaxID=3438736 RepID=UPI003F91B926